jgi:hypothetical protein
MKVRVLFIIGTLSQLFIFKESLNLGGNYLLKEVHESASTFHYWYIKPIIYF